MRILQIIFSLMVIISIFGCANEQESQPMMPLNHPRVNDPRANPESVNVPLRSKNGSSGTAPSGKIVMPPGMAVGTSTKLAPTPQLDAWIATLEKKKGTQKQLSVAYTTRGYTRMTDTKAAPRIMYPAALRDFRRALQLDPSNAQAKQYKELIEGIYRKMGRPIPS